MTGRLNFRVRAEPEKRLREAAHALGMTLTDFVVTSALTRADDVLATRTVVPPDYFDQLVTALDAPNKPNKRLRAAFQRATDLVSQEVDPRG